jgi:hypothetical protein
MATLLDTKPDSPHKNARTADWGAYCYGAAPWLNRALAAVQPLAFLRLSRVRTIQDRESGGQTADLR